MADLLDGAALEELKEGVQNREDVFCCLVCGKTFQKGEIFPVGERFFDAERAAKHHVQAEHGGMLEVMLTSGKQALFTDNQQRLLRLIAEGRTDAEIAAETRTALSTVRHQKFVFREKMKQAKLVLAACQLAFAGKTAEQDRLLPPHGGAKMVDDRYLITEEERDKIIAGAFSSLSPLTLKAIPPKEKKKVVILRKIAEGLDPDRHYTEKELNEFLKGIHEDYVTLRRYLIEYGFMDRMRDGSEYWKRGE